MNRHDLIMLKGWAGEWYWNIVQEVLDNHIELPCRQGIAWESPNSLLAIIPPAATIFEALAIAYTPRRGKPVQRMTFSILYSLRRILGYHDTVLFDKYPILREYTQPQPAPYYARSIAYTRHEIPKEERQSTYISQERIGEAEAFTIDQIQRAVYLMSNPASRHSKRALIDFGEGFKARCVMSWLFLIRDEKMRIYQHMRSNDLVVGMPNNLIDGRLGQIVMSAIEGSEIGVMHHQSSLIQIYKRDIAGVDCIAELDKLRRDPEDSESVVEKMKEVPIIRDITTLLSEDIGSPTMSLEEGFARYYRIMDGLENIFWSYNCSFAKLNHTRSCSTIV